MARKPKASATPPAAPPPADDMLDDPKFLQYVVANGGLGLDPLSDEALRLQAKYVASVGDHPLDVLKSFVRNPFLEPKERISAAKVLLEYGARKIPAQLELTGKDGAALVVDSSALGRLSVAELEQLETLLTKAQGA